MKTDVITRAMTSCGNARIIVVNTTNAINEAIKYHDLAPTATAALGRALTASSMIGIMLLASGALGGPISFVENIVYGGVSRLAALPFRLFGLL